jgi:GNAT superfamily N-acetyltransferase
MGRMVEDGIMYMIYDVIVRPEYQKQGHGKNIMNSLLDKITPKEDYVRVGLFTFEDPELIKFYESFGFEKEYGMTMIKKV